MTSFLFLSGRRINWIPPSGTFPALLKIRQALNRVFYNIFDRFARGKCGFPQDFPSLCGNIFEYRRNSRKKDRWPENFGHLSERAIVKCNSLKAKKRSSGFEKKGEIRGILSRIAEKRRIHFIGVLSYKIHDNIKRDILPFQT